MKLRVGELTAAMRMHDQALCWPYPTNGYVQCRHGQIDIMLLAYCPADNLATEQIHYTHQIQPALTGRDIGRIGDPLLIFARCIEVLIEQIRRKISALFGFSQSQQSAHNPHGCLDDRNFYCKFDNRCIYSQLE